MFLFVTVYKANRIHRGPFIKSLSGYVSLGEKNEGQLFGLFDQPRFSGTELWKVEVKVSRRTCFSKFFTSFRQGTNLSARTEKFLPGNDRETYICSYRVSGDQA
jgi:hypothetical protein